LTGSSYDWITPVVAIVGLGLALLSLGWQAATFALSGSRVRAEIKRGASGGGNAIIGPAEVWTTRTVASLATQGLTTEVLAVSVRNVGRLAVTVDEVAVVFSNRGRYLPPEGSKGNPPVPWRLEPGSSKTWYAEAIQPRAYLAAARLPDQRVRFAVTLGNGKTVETDRIAIT
jgi:hypothetical protein